MLVRSNVETIYIIFFGGLFLFSSIINYYVPTFFFIELFTIFTTFYYVVNNQKKLIDIKLLIPLFIVLFLASYSLLLHPEINGNYKEMYRFMSIIFIIFSLALLRINFNQIILLTVNITRLYIIYNLYEVFTINFASIESLYFYNYILDYFGTAEGQYFLPTWQYGFPMYRPFGLWFQPQKTGFIFTFAIIFQYLYKRDLNNKTHSLLWISLYIFSQILVGGKTAIIASIIIVLILYVDIKKITISQVFIFTILAFFSAYFYINVISGDSSEGALAKDISALLNLNIFKILFGSGSLPFEELLKLNFATESFIVRIVFNLGILNTILLSLTFFIVIAKYNKISLVIFVVLFFSVIHYAILNVPYFIFLLSIIIQYNKEKKLYDRSQLNENNVYYS